MNIRTNLSVVSAFAIALTFAGSVAAAPPSTCNAAFVTHSRNVFTVKPTGGADTVNLQCAFDAAVTAGTGAEVRLAPGTFHTAQIVVNNFHGRWQGAGMDRTVIMNLPNLVVAPGDFYLNPPSASNPGPYLFAFVGGDIAVSDLAIKIVGAEPTTGWTIFGLDTIKSLAVGIVFEDTHVDVRVDRIQVTGEVSTDWLYGYNLYNGVYFENFIGALPTLPVSGSNIVTQSKFRFMAGGTSMTDVTNARVVFNHNEYQDVVFAADSGDLVNSTYEFTDNKVSAMYGVNLYDQNRSLQSSDFLIRNNQFHGKTAIDIEMTLSNTNKCLIEGNSVQDVTDPAIILGPHTTGCVLKGNGARTSILDLGTDNTIIGGNRHDKGDRPKPHMFFTLRK